MELPQDAPRHIEGSREWYGEIMHEKDRVLDVSEKYDIPIRFQDYPPSEKPYLHYVTFHHLASSSSAMQELIMVHANLLADYEEMLWNDTTSNIRCYLGMKSVRHLENFIRKFPLLVLGPTVRLFIADSKYFDTEEYEEEDSEEESDTDITDCDTNDGSDVEEIPTSRL